MRGVYAILMMTFGVYLVYGQQKAGYTLMVLVGLWMCWTAFFKIYNLPE